jgi:hypothetical protein
MEPLLKNGRILLLLMNIGKKKTNTASLLF